MKQCHKMESFNLKNSEGLHFLKSVKKDSVSLVLTDPPYVISHDTGMNAHYNNVKNNTCAKSEQDWNDYLTKNASREFTDIQKQNFLSYGSIYGKKYAVCTDYDEWDKQFTMETLSEFVKEFYRVLKPGGTLILFFDIWKIETLKNLMETHKFKQLRFIEWIKTNPQPLNSKINYLTNCREIALVGVKGSKPTFNTKYHKGIFEYPIQGKPRFHPTQKNVDLFAELINIHSNENDIVLDTFLGSGTTAVACKSTNRICWGSEPREDYYSQLVERLNTT